MLTTSETILFATVWVLTLCGLFFGGRAKLRKHRNSSTDRRQESKEKSGQS